LRPSARLTRSERRRNGRRRRRPRGRRRPSKGLRIKTNPAIAARARAR
jgi:hypothetical protein